MRLYLKFEKTFEETLKMAKSMSNNHMKAHAGAFYIGLKLYAIFYPHMLLAKVMEAFGQIHTLFFSNVAGF
jgi:hypothetical protein